MAKMGEREGGRHRKLGIVSPSRVPVEPHVECAQSSLDDIVDDTKCSQAFTPALDTKFTHRRKRHIAIHVRGEISGKFRIRIAPSFSIGKDAKTRRRSGGGKGLESSTSRN